MQSAGVYISFNISIILILVLHDIVRGITNIELARVDYMYNIYLSCYITVEPA